MANSRRHRADFGMVPLERSIAPPAESCIRKAVVERGLTPGLVGLADAKAEDEAASRWADCPFPAESCIRKAVVERGLTPGLVGLADAKAEDEAASRWADC